MNKIIILAVLGISSTLSNVSLAEKNYYGGSVSYLEASDVDNESVDLYEPSFTLFVGRLGREINENFSAEVRLGVGIGDDSIKILGTSIHSKLDHMIGAYIRGGIETTHLIYPYLILGYTRSEFEFSSPLLTLTTSSESISDIAFGLGADFDVTDNLSINFEYMNYYDKDQTEINGFTFGLATHF